jgi:hypothetical protein
VEVLALKLLRVFKRLTNFKEYNMPTMAEIKDALINTEPFEVQTGHTRGWNAGVLDVTTGNHGRNKSYNDDPWYVDGFYHNLGDQDYYGDVEVDWYEGWNEGKEAALAMKEGKEKSVSEKTPEEIQYERRMKCFTMSEKYAPNAAIRGGEREPVGETIGRAEILYGYFYSGAIPGSAVKEEK